jgi:hypothetical protein
LFGPDGLPDMARTFSNSDLKLVADGVLDACDTKDGLADGMVQHLEACTTAVVRPALDARICKGPKAETCLAAEQVEALVKSLAGPSNSSGQALYSDWPWDPGLGHDGWRMWKLGQPGRMPAINVDLGASALSGLFMTPPPVVAGSPQAGQRFQMAFDLDKDAPKIFGTSPKFPRSGWDLVGAQATDLSAFHSRGGKMLIPHGGADPIFSINDTNRWWRDVNTVEKGSADGFVRVFAVPGMTHCAMGPATDQYDALGALMDWVETGKAPDRIEATAGPATPWPGRPRPLCAYPSYASYKSGDPERAGSFVCERPSQ